MRLKSKLMNWKEAGLINDDQSQSIQNFEGQKLHDKLQDGLKYAGYFAVLLGVALIIAANWDAIGIYFKLGAHVVINSILAWCIWIWRNKPNKSFLREGAVYFLSGLTLTLLALIGQSFQLQGDIGGLLMLWLGLVTGMVIIAGQNLRIVSLWFIGFLITLFNNIEKISLITPEFLAFFIILSMILFLPLGGYMLSQWPSFQRMNRYFTQRLKELSIVSALIFGGLASLIFYARNTEFSFINDMGVLNYNLCLMAISIIYCGLIFINRKMFDKNSSALLIGLSGLFTLTPLFFMIQIDILGAIHFIVFMILLSAIAVKYNLEGFLSLCLFAISVRLFIVFIELFGSMMSTGWGLMVSGIILLGILKATSKIRMKIMEGMHA